jgi:uncharacterized protein
MAASSVEVEWDPGKALRNFTKHQVRFEEAASVFHDPMFITVIDAEHSDAEELKNGILQ